MPGFARFSKVLCPFCSFGAGEPHCEIRRAFARWSLGGIERFGRTAAVDQRPDEHHPIREILRIGVHRPAEPLGTGRGLALTAMDQPDQMMKLRRRGLAELPLGEVARLRKVSSLERGYGFGNAGLHRNER